MAPVSSISSATQSGLQQIMVQQAKRNADQAEQTAQSLRAQADAAQRTAEKAQETARSLTLQSDQAQQQADQARQGLAAVTATQQGITSLSNTINQMLDRKLASIPATPSTTTPGTGAAPVPPVVNTQGQVTGTIINTAV